MQYLLDRLPPPVSAGSCGCFLGIARIWWVSASSKPRPGWTVWHRWGYWPLLLGFYLAASSLCCGTVHHPGKKINTSLLDLVAMSRAEPQPKELVRALSKNLVMFPCQLTDPLQPFLLIHPWGHLQVRPLAFISVGTGLYLYVPQWLSSE